MRLNVERWREIRCFSRITDSTEVPGARGVLRNQLYVEPACAHDLFSKKSSLNQTPTQVDRMTEPSHPRKSAPSRPTQTDAKTILSLKKA